MQQQKINESIPLIVDDVKMQQNFQMTRFNYFSVETIDNVFELTIKHETLELPVTVVNLHGIITGTPDGSEFSTKDHIQDLFDSVDDSASFFVDTNDLWLPNSLFDERLSRGDLIRIPPELFKLALAYRSDSLSYDDFIEKSMELSSQIRTYPSEQKAFREWTEEQIKFSYEVYHAKDEDRKLKYIEEANQ